MMLLLRSAPELVLLSEILPRFQDDGLSGSSLCRLLLFVKRELERKHRFLLDFRSAGD